jgi:hypothetical protein
MQITLIHVLEQLRPRSRIEVKKGKHFERLGMDNVENLPPLDID